MKRNIVIILLSSIGLLACATTSDQGTLAGLEAVVADIDEIYVDDSLDRAAQSYRRYLEETSESARTPEAMRRFADLQIEQAYGVNGSGELVEMAAPDTANLTRQIVAERQTSGPIEPVESEQEFEQRATERHKLLTQTTGLETQLPGGENVSVSVGPREAIETYRTLLETYPDYERNDQVLYQLSRAYDEIGEPDKAIEVTDRLVAEYPYSRYIDEVYFRRGEYHFVRKRYLDAEDAYNSVVRMGKSSSYFDLALYKLGWALYKQELYEEALHKHIAMLDYRLSIGYDFDQEP